MSDSKEDKWYPVRIAAVVLVFGTLIITGFNVIIDSNNSRSHARALKDDIKARCKPVYNTIEGKRMTTIYNCAADDGGDDIKYEFTERL